MIVVDASVVTKLFLPEASSPQASALITSTPYLYAPEIIRIEVSAAIVRAARNGRISSSDAVSEIQRWQRRLDTGVITLAATGLDLEDATLIALQLRHPLPDCLYLALAERLDVPLVTADMIFLAKASPLFPRVAPLAGT